MSGGLFSSGGKYLFPAQDSGYRPGVHHFFVRVIAAAPPSLWDQFRSVSKQTWINLAICVLAVVVIVRVWRGLKKINDFVPYIVAVLAAFLIFFYWVYERCEPRFLTPLVEKLAPFFPSKSTQELNEQKRRRGRDV
jgi:flagellar biosynthesis protein FliQ